MDSVEKLIEYDIEIKMNRQTMSVPTFLFWMNHRTEKLLNLQASVTSSRSYLPQFTILDFGVRDQQHVA